MRVLAFELAAYLPHSLRVVLRGRHETLVQFFLREIFAARLAGGAGEVLGVGQARCFHRDLRDRHQSGETEGGVPANA